MLLRAGKASSDGLNRRTLFCRLMVFVIWSGVLLSQFLSSRQSYAELPVAGSPEDLATRYVEAFERRELASVRRQQMPRLQSRVQLMVPRPTVSGNPSSDASLLQLVEHTLISPAADSAKASIAAETQQMVSAVDSLSANLNSELQRAKADWIAARAKRIQLEVDSMEMATAGNLAAQVATLLNARNKWLWMGVVFSAAGLIATGWYTRRHYFRRLFWVRQNRYRFLLLCMGLLLLIPIVPAAILFLTGDMAYLKVVGATVSESPLSKEQRLISELIDDPQAKEDERQVADGKRRLQETVESQLGTRMGGVVLSNGKPAIQECVRTLENMIELQAHRNLLARIVGERDGLTQGAEDQSQIGLDKKSLETAKKQVEDNGGKLQQARSLSYWIAAGLGITILSVFGLTGLVLLKKESASGAIRRTTCPQCYTKRSMKLVTNKQGVVSLACSAEIENEMGISEPCGFTYDASNGDLPKLMFPTLGINATGKTHWMAMNYRQLNFGNAPDGVHFERLKSDKTEEFDDKIRMLLENRSAFQATYHTQGFVHPLMFVLQDIDPLPFSGTQLIANLLDLGGIVTRERNHPLRNSALNGDGYLFFLDPTRDIGEQNEALNLFREDVRMVKRLKPNQQMQRPLAICVSKIDLIGTDAYVGPLAAVADEFYRALREADAAHPAMSIALIRARHEIMESYIQTLFPGWDVVKSVESLFGPRVSFFPLTPVGLQGSGEDAFLRRAQDPYAILEPLLWLIHMNGYPILR